MTLPERAGRRVFETLGRLAHRPARRRPRDGRRRTRPGSSGPTPDDERVALATREAFELYARFWFDAFRIRTVPVRGVQPNAR